MEAKTKQTIKSRIVSISNELRLVKDGTNSFANYDYFKPDSILTALNPLLEKYNLIALFNLEYSKEIEMYKGLLIIEDLDTIEKVDYRFDIPLTSVKGASLAQGAGATQTYAKRYMLMNAFNIASNEDDLDSKDNSTPEKPKEASKNEPQGGSEEQLCPQCGAVAVWREGKNKQGKKWNGYFCAKDKKHDPVWYPVRENSAKGILKSMSDEDKVNDIAEQEFINEEYGN